jgi:UDP:flavonoid glycosyltransferase YjiC (YdhE family)
MRILFVATPVAGHTLPLVPLAWAARVAGHDILFATGGEAMPLVVHAGLAAIEVVKTANLTSEVMEYLTERYTPRAGELIALPPPSLDNTNILVKPEEWSSSHTVHEEFKVELCHPLALFFGNIGERAIDPIVRIARAWGAQALIYEPCMVVGLVAARAVGIPAFCHGFGVFHPWAIPAMPAMSKSRKRYGLTDTVWEPVVNIDVCPESIRSNCLNSGWPMRYTPYNNEAVLPAWLIESRSRRPRVCVTMGTTVPIVGSMGPLDIIIDALSRCDVDVIVLGAEGTIEKPLPGNIRSPGWLPLNAVLPTCSAIIHHGGAGTTFTALVAGVPQLVLPQFADQPLNAAAVAFRGVGIYLLENETDAASVRDRLFRLLNDSAISQAATEVREEIAAMPSPSEIVDRLTTAISAHTAKKSNTG